MSRCKRFLATLALIAWVAQAQASPDAALLDQARTYLLDQDYVQAIAVYETILDNPDSGYHATALEYLGVAYEKLGRYDDAATSYQKHLSRFADSPSNLPGQDQASIDRVRQRATALEALKVSRAGRPEVQPNAGVGLAGFRLRGSLTQDYWQYVESPVEDADKEIERSALLTLFDGTASRVGERFDVLARVSIGHQNLIEGRSSVLRNTEDSEWHVSNAFLQVQDQALDVGYRLGRQTLHTDGVLGRFDGVRVSHRLRPRTKVHLTLGAPVDSPRYAIDTSRPMLGASLHFDELLPGFADALGGTMSAKAFVIAQEEDGISSREAAGGELAFKSERLRLLGSVDYDWSYGTLNSAFVHADYYLNERLHLHARANTYAAPFLTSGNAIIGQPTTSLERLLDLFTEAELRTIARNRTADANRFAAGFNYLLSTRWYLNADFAYTELTSTPASAGVAAFPATEQVFSSATFVGSSIFRQGDTTLVGVRVTSDTVADTSTLFFDCRLPFGDSLRVGPKLAVSWRDAGVDGDEQLIVEPGLRATYRFRKRYSIELDAVGRWSERTLPQDDLQSLDPSLQALFGEEEERTSSLFFTLGWRMDF